MVLGLGVRAAELVARREQGDRCQRGSPDAGRQVVTGPEQHHGRERVGDVVDDVVQARTVEARDGLLDAQASCQHAVGPVDDQRRQQDPQRADLVAVHGGRHREQGEHRAARGVEVQRPSGDTQARRSHERLLSRVDRRQGRPPGAAS